MIGFLKKKKRRKEEQEMSEIKKDIDEAKDKIEEKGKDTQTEKDRVDESVGEQIKDDKDENTQTAKDRVDESEGAEKKDEDAKVEEKPEPEKPSDSDVLKEMIRNVVAEVVAAEVKAAFAEMAKNDKSGRESHKVEDEQARKLAAFDAKYNN